jgi:mono/diheme cytochrome c family protein/cytochrome c553
MRTRAAGIPGAGAGRRRRAAGLAVCLGAVGLLLAGSSLAAQKTPWPNAGEDPGVTPVAGPSWLHHLGVSPATTRLGQGASHYGPSDEEPAAALNEPLGVRRTLVVTGHDLYRLNCQACHRDEGTGVPPEIRSVLGPVQGTSLEMVRKQLQATPHAPGDARAKADRARADLVARIRTGGQRMPARDHLQQGDINEILGYLTQLAGTPSPDLQSQRTITWARLGEHTVKGTCHICHDAVGPSPSADAIAKGAVPSLESLLATKSVAEFVRKARSGAHVVRGDVAVLHRGRMPVLDYLRAEDIAAAYMYLSTYPPQPGARRRP